MDTHTYTHKHAPLSCCCAAADCGQKNLTHTHVIYVIVVALGDICFFLCDVTSLIGGLRLLPVLVNISLSWCFISGVRAGGGSGSD